MTLHSEIPEPAAVDNQQGQCSEESPSVSPLVEEEYDYYSTLKSLERRLELIDIREEYVKKEIESLRSEMTKAIDEFRMHLPSHFPVGLFIEAIDNNHAIIETRSERQRYVKISSMVNQELLKPLASVGLHRQSSSLLEVLPSDLDYVISLGSTPEKQDVTFAEIGGYDVQKREIREVVEFPLTHHHLCSKIGIRPPRGVLLYGPPGTGKTMLAEAVANRTSAAFFRASGPVLFQRCVDVGTQIVRDMFRIAKEKAPAIIFIDDVDAIATARFDADSGRDMETRSILIELLNQMDGFDQTVNVMVIMATNRADTLDPALLRPGRLDRKIEFLLPDRREKRLIFQVCTAKMNLSDEVDLEDYSSLPDKISPAEIAGICQEAGMRAIRKKRHVVLAKDFEKSYASTVKKSETKFDFYN